MLLQIFLFALGLFLIVVSANSLVDGSSSVARKLGVSEFVIGLTIVGFGTSCPELVVSLTGAFQGNADVSIGNVLGSNIFNTLLILGITAILSPIAISKSNQKRDLPITLFVSLVFACFALSDHEISRWEGIVFLLLFVTYLYSCFKFDKPNLSTPSDTDLSKTKQPSMKTAKAIALIILGLGGLILGGRLFVDNAVLIAKSLGVSDKFIAITLLAGGTSLPELATCIVASAKKMEQLALGNVLGSNVFNILLILGASSVVTPLSTQSMSLVDLACVVGSVLLLIIWSFTGKKKIIDRWEAILLLLMYIGYMAYICINI